MKYVVKVFGSLHEFGREKLMGEVDFWEKKDAEAAFTKHSNKLGARCEMWDGKGRKVRG